MAGVKRALLDAQPAQHGIAFRREADARAARFVRDRFDQAGFVQLRNLGFGGRVDGRVQQSSNVASS